MSENNVFQFDEVNIKKETMEAVSDVQHEIWAHWMNYQSSCGSLDDSGNFVIPKEKYERWTRQMNTPYSELTEKEKASDRDQAMKVFDVLVNRKRNLEFKPLVSLGLIEQDLITIAKLAENKCHIKIENDQLEVWHILPTMGYRVCSFPISHGSTIFELVIRGLHFEQEEDICKKLIGDIEAAIN